MLGDVVYGFLVCRKVLLNEIISFRSLWGFWLVCLCGFRFWDSFGVDVGVGL